MSQHFIYLFCKHFTHLFLSFYPFKTHFFYQHFICLFSNVSLLFSRFTFLLKKKLRSFVVPDEISAERYFKIPHFRGRFKPFYYLIFTLLFISLYFFIFIFVFYIFFLFICHSRDISFYLFFLF